MVPPRRWLAGSLAHRGGEAASPPWPGRQHTFSRDSTYSGVLCRLSHLSLLMDMQAPLGCRRRGGVGRPTSDPPDQLLQNMRRCIRVGGGVRRPSFGLMGIPSLCRRVRGHWGLARCRRSQEARRRRGAVEAAKGKQWAAVKRSFPQVSKCRTGNDLQGESKKHIPARIRSAVDTRALTQRISLRGQLDHGDIGQIRRRQREKITKRIPLWASSAHTPPRPPSPA